AHAATGLRQDPDHFFRRSGDYWEIAYNGKVMRLRRSVGLDYLRVLLRDPVRELFVLDLIAAAGVTARGRTATSSGTKEQSSPTPGADEKARAAYRQRIAELQTAIADAERNNDIGAAQRLRHELTLLTDEVRRAVGLGGRTRADASDLERARSAVGKRIK